MGDFLVVGDVSQWLLCLLQITGLMLCAWLAGRMLLQKFPEISATIGIIGLIFSAALILITWTGIPRPFELVGETERLTSPASNTTQDTAFISTTKSDFDAKALFYDLITFIENTKANRETLTSSGNSWWFQPEVFIQTLLLLTAMGCLAGLFCLAHSSIAIYLVSRSSVEIEDPIIQAEISRLLALAPSTQKPKNISVRKLNGPGSPFVSWLTGHTIYLPESFLQWSTNERTASLAHEIGHLLRRDHHWHVAAKLALYCTWLHPLAWILHRQITLAQELAADQIAAQSTHSTTAYCRGLSRLALRFDVECRQTSAIGVSVSSSLIRRITMLRKSTFHRLPCSRFASRLVTCLTVVACSWISCWSVAAQTTNPANPSVNSGVVTASHTSPVKMFSQQKANPWDSVGDQSGYVRVQANRLLNHPEFKVFKPILASTLNSVFRPTPEKASSSEQFGLEVDKIDWIQSGLRISYRYHADEPLGRRSRLTLGASTIEIIAKEAVDWRGLIEALDVEKLSGLLTGQDVAELDQALDGVQKAWSQAATKSRSNVFQTDGILGATPESKEPSETMKELWNAVSGGAATVVYDINQSGKIPVDYKEEGEFNQANLEMTVATKTAAWGLDLTPDYKRCQIRFAAVPKTGVSMGQFMEKFEAVKKALLATDAEDEFSRHLLEQLRQVKVTVVKGQLRNGERIPPYLMVAGECSADFGKFGLIKHVSAPPRSQTTAEVKSKKK